MSEPKPVDHKDEPGEYRRRVRDSVLRRTGGPGRPVSDPSELVGDWDATVLPPEGRPVPGPEFVYRLRPGGEAAVEPADGSWPASAAEWRLNRDGTLSLLTWCPADPEYGMDEPELDEDRRHLAALPDGRLVTWNGDGSSAILLSPRATGSGTRP